MKKKENLFNFDSIPLSKTKESYLNINYQNPLPNLQPESKLKFCKGSMSRIASIKKPSCEYAKKHQNEI